MRHPLLAVLLAVVIGGPAATSACNDPARVAVCNDLAAPGCPADQDADVCSDLQCAAVYACDNGTWSMVATCPNYSADAAAHPAEAGSGDAASAFDAPFDAPPGAFGGPGCVDLQEPDCPLGTALACGGAPDCCGCVDLYVCANGGWVHWGACVDGGLSSSGH